MALQLVPVTRNGFSKLSRLTPAALRSWVDTTHRHLPALSGWKFGVGAAVDGKLVGVGVVGNGPRRWQHLPIMVIARIATDGTPNACSFLMGALCRAGKALGYTQAWTYTLPSESGVSLRAAGFEDAGVSAGGEWSRPSRKRGKAKKPEPKRRWRKIL